MLEAVPSTGRQPLPARALPPSLDDPACWPGFGILHSAGGTGDAPGSWTSQFAIEGVYCGGCALLIEAAVRSVPGVSGVQVDSGATRAEVRWDPAMTRPSAIVQAIARAGYRARPGQHPTLLAMRRAEQRKLLWRWLVAGLCMMQVMMYAMPAYVAAEGDMTPEELMLLRWASWVLTLPVMFFSCSPMFKRAAADLRAGRVGMDLPVTLGITIAFIASTAATFSTGSALGGEVYFDSLTMFVFLLLSVRWLEGRLKSRTAGALEALIERLPDTVARLRPSTGGLAAGPPERFFERIALSQVGLGDILRIEVDEAFPADGRIVEGRTQVDESLLTGESTPLPRSAEPGSEQVIAGAMNRGASILMQVERVGGATRMGEIVALMASAAMRKPQLAVMADRIAAPFMACVVLAAIGSLMWWWPTDPSRALMVCVAVLIVTCPCALSLATPAATLAAAGTLARRGVLVRHLDAMEALARCDIVVFDKTGTLTDDSLRVDRVVVRDGVDPGWAAACAMALAKESAHPVSRAVAAMTPTPSTHDVSALSAVSFKHSIREVPGQGLSGRLPDGRLVSLGAGSPAADVGVRRLMPGKTDAGDLQPQCHLADDSGWMATFILSETLRPEARAAVDGLRALGCQVVLLSGDRPQAVARIARLLALDDHAGGCSPEDKLERVRAMQDAGHRVAMAGDGINDGPVLSAADVSFAVGTEAPLACAHADFVILGARLASLPEAVALSRRGVRVVRQNLTWAALYNAACVPLAMAAWLPAWAAGLGMALSSLVVVANAARLTRASRFR